MSLILDALKKLDREKSSRRNRTTNIAVEILRPDLPRPVKKFPRYLATASLAAVVAAAITYVMVTGFGFLSKNSPPVTMNPPAPSQQVASVPVPLDPVRGVIEEIRVPQKIPNEGESKSPATANSQPSPGPIVARPTSQPVTPDPVPRERIRNPREAISRVPPKIQNDEENKPSATFPGEKTSQPVGREDVSVAPASPQKPTEPIPAEPAVDPASLRLSGILWSEKPSERRAAINGAVLTEGSMIDGAKVLEILPSRVRLSHNGKPFEISMGGF